MLLIISNAPRQWPICARAAAAAGMRRLRRPPLRLPTPHAYAVAAAATTARGIGFRLATNVPVSNLRCSQQRRGFLTALRPLYPATKDSITSSAAGVVRVDDAGPQSESTTTTTPDSTAKMITTAQGDLDPSALPKLPYRFDTGVALFPKRPPRPFPPPFLSPPSGSFSDPLSTHDRSRDRRKAYVDGHLIQGFTNGDDAVFASRYFVCADDGVGAWSTRPRGHAG